MIHQELIKINRINEITPKKIISTLIEKQKYLENGFEESQINSHPNKPYCDKGKLKLKVAPLTIIDENIPTKRAKEFILDGRYAIQLLGAGAATRLGAGPMFGLDITSLNNIKNNLMPLPLGVRHILGYKSNLIELAEDLNKDPSEVISKQTFIVHLNENSAQECINLFLENNFFGFNKKNIVFCIQETHPAFRIEKDEIISKSKNTYPYGHGHTLLQLNKEKEGFIINENGEKEFIENTIINYLKYLGVSLISSHRINDLTKISKDSICPKRISHTLNKFDEGSHVVVELVGNPKNQKGGKWLKWENHEKHNHNFLIEGLNAKDKFWSKAFEELEENHYREHREGIPYNAFRIMYNILELESLLEEGLIPSLRQREEGLTFEITTGDITQNPNSKSSGFQIKDELIHDFKTLDDLDEALRYISSQDSNKTFQQEAKKYS